MIPGIFRMEVEVVTQIQIIFLAIREHVDHLYNC
jgi:hypothetical protein